MAALLALGLPLVAQAAPTAVTFPTLRGEYTLTVDGDAFTEGELRSLAMLSPYLYGWRSHAVAPRLELCLTDDPAYLDCGARSLEAKNYFWNARVNLDRGARELDALQRLRYPEELEPVVAHLLRSLAFSLWLEETRFAYYHSWDAAVLRRTWEGIEPGAACRTVFERLEQTATREERYRLAVHDWHNCVNDAFRRRLGEYPLEAWQRFLRAHGIEERVADPFEAGVPR